MDRGEMLTLWSDMWKDGEYTVRRAKNVRRKEIHESH